MSGGFVIEPLGGAHDRSGFACGVAALDRYFREQVTQDIRRRLTNCFVAVDPQGVVAGYYTLAATSLPMTDLPPEESRRLPRYPVLPAALIGRLAVAAGFRGQGLGGGFLVDALARSLRSEPAIYALLVDAKDAAAERFYVHHGCRPLASRPHSLFLALAAAARLHIGVHPHRLP
ncbi:MAG: GNAT family N-acetyltransferase [Acidisphaera sp.]|nr:GNAT family N-acetyltransferase [Acidisphaera sp.]MBV9811639.1 GNAT family N-acetyltransferase [Acetobacteraceae bacterium]